MRSVTTPRNVLEPQVAAHAKEMIGFVPASQDKTERYRDEPDEIVMVMPPGNPTHAA